MNCKHTIVSSKISWKVSCKHFEIDRQSDRQMENIQWIDRQIDRRIDRWIDRQIDRYIDRQIDRQNRQIVKCCSTLIISNISSRQFLICCFTIPIREANCWNKKSLSTKNIFQKNFFSNPRIEIFFQILKKCIETKKELDNFGGASVIRYILRTIINCIFLCETVGLILHYYLQLSVGGNKNQHSPSFIFVITPFKSLLDNVICS